MSADEVGWAQLLAVFAFARLLTAIPITPGGLGVIELALITSLNAAGGDHEQVVGAVLIFRVLTYVLPIPFGLTTYAFWRRSRSWRDTAGSGRRSRPNGLRPPLDRPGVGRPARRHGRFTHRLEPGRHSPSPGAAISKC